MISDNDVHTHQLSRFIIDRHIPNNFKQINGGRLMGSSRISQIIIKIQHAAKSAKYKIYNLFCDLVFDEMIATFLIF